MFVATMVGCRGGGLLGFVAIYGGFCGGFVVVCLFFFFFFFFFFLIIKVPVVWLWLWQWVVVAGLGWWL